MTGIAMTYETPIRLGFFFGLLGTMAIWEWLAPRRPLSVSRTVRWSNNLALVFLNGLAVRLVVPMTGVGMATLAEQRHWGLLNNLSVPFAVALVLSVVALDLAIYFQHVLFHAVPALWRLHRMHHADLDFDVTTGARFHPLEIVLSMGIKLGAIVVLGPPAIAVLAFEVLLNATAMFNHGNARMPAALDRVLRRIVVTPDMHRIHHSIVPRETNSNFGFNLPWWDRWFGTYLAQPGAGHAGMTIGIGQFRTVRDLRLDRMLLQPFVHGASVDSGATHGEDQAAVGRRSVR
jgi:sterol desaturase/sphingolipid hydroxylase (fatty acid hydroxylase superfamily)